MFWYTFLIECGRLRRKYQLTWTDQKLWNVCRHALLSSTLRTKSSFTKDGCSLRASSCTSSRPSLNIQTHFLTMPSLIALSPHTWQIGRWISLVSTFLAFKNWITDQFHGRRPLQLSLTCLTQGTNINITRISRNGACGFSIDRGSHCTCAKLQSRGCARDMRRR